MSYVRMHQFKYTLVVEWQQNLKVFKVSSSQLTSSSLINKRNKGY